MEDFDGPAGWFFSQRAAPAPPEVPLGDLADRYLAARAEIDRLERQLAATQAARRAERETASRRIAELERLQARPGADAPRLATLEAALQRLTDRLERLARRAEAAEQEITALRGDLDAHRGRVDGDLPELAPLERRVAMQAEALADKEARIARLGEAGDAPPQPEGPDDLTRIWGIGPGIERTLHQLGIVSFRQIAELSEPELSSVREALGVFRGRIERDAWSAQARRIVQ